MALDKAGLLTSNHSIKFVEGFFIVEPGGLSIYERAVHEAFATSPPRTPAEWKEPVFISILGHDLVGGEFHYDVDTLEPMSILEE